MNINELDKNMFIDENDKPWRKIRSKGYVVISEDETLIGTATLLFSNDYGCYKCADIERGIEAGMHEDETTAKILFEELIEIHLEGKIYWER